MNEKNSLPTPSTPVPTMPKNAAELEKENQELKLKLAFLEGKTSQIAESNALAAPQPQAAPKGKLTSPVRFISRYRRYKPHLKNVTEDFGTHKSNRVVTAQFADCSFQTDDAEIADLIRAMKQFRKIDDPRPGGEVWEMLPGENLRSAMARLGIKDTGEVIQYSGAVDSRMSQARR